MCLAALDALAIGNQDRIDSEIGHETGQFRHFVGNPYIRPYVLNRVIALFLLTNIHSARQGYKVYFAVSTASVGKNYNKL